jgi:excisionase family DNA binding protein
MGEDLIKYAEAARVLDVPVGTLYAMVSRKSIPHVRIGKRLVRFSRARLASWIEQRTVACSAASAASGGQ